MKPSHLVWIRRFCQAFFLCLFIYLLIGTKLPLNVYMDYSLSFAEAQDIRIKSPVTFFFQLDPLVWLSSVISSRQWITGFGWAIGLLAATIFFGRFFCSFICPFGTLHHMAGSIRPSLKGSSMIDANQKNNSRRIKYFLLIAFIGAAAVGVNYAGLMDPISFLFRSLAVSILPAIGIGLTDFFEALAFSDIKVFNYLGYGLEALAAPVFGYENKAFQTGWVIGFLFLVILFLNRIRPRFWCRVLCPLGALLGICSKFNILTLAKDENKCTHCGACVKNCQGAASPEPGQIWQTAECFLCFNCANCCPENALTFRFRKLTEKTTKTDIGRRAVMGGLLAGVSLPLLGRLDGNLSKTSAPNLIRPPGSLSESNFLDRCQRCGLCMKVCPTNVINPALSEAGLAGFWTPNLIMTLGYCEYTCTLCTSVCPTGAIKELTAKEKIKTPIRIGSAYVDRGRCLPWNGNTPCIVCEEHCPTSPKAIYFKKDVIIRPDGQKIEIQLPYVDLKRCTGCGICEFKCPVKGKPAIRTISAGESRSLENQILL
ncbi:MAG: 4Fe-4S binding protein [Desulfobacteraceae bacterium]|nr:4Fe-4S binding protein [Desulfobacteraceae bacterium]MBC2756301.1 4Fe-4S binding protein [Desulfobacteraceae bacterium]